MDIGPIGRERLLENLHDRIRDVRQGLDCDLYVLTDEDQCAMLRIEPVEAQQGQAASRSSRHTIAELAGS